MKRWQDLAIPDDPDSWYDVDGFWPTQRDSYEIAYGLTGSDIAATGATTPLAAFYGERTVGSSTSIKYVVDTGHIWHVSVTPAVNRIGAISQGNQSKFAQYGNITIIAQGATQYSGDSAITGGNTIYADVGSNFAALTGAPDATCIAIQSNCVFLGNTSNARDGYSISDVGDYTNWTTGDAVTNRIIDTPGPITAAVSFAGAIYVFKRGAIYRLTYVGGVLKWRSDKVWEGVGAFGTGTQFNQACAGATGILFLGTNLKYYWYDGINPPVLCNPLTTVPASASVPFGSPVIVYCPAYDVFTVWAAGAAYYFSPRSMSWGRFTTSMGAGAPTTCPVEGNIGSYPTTECWAQVTSNNLRRFVVSIPTTSAGTRYVETTKIGGNRYKSALLRATPKLRRRTDVGTQSASGSLSLFRELHDTTAQRTLPLTESTYGNRFDLGPVADNYARLKVTYTDYDVEIDGIDIEGQPAGKN